MKNELIHKVEIGFIKYFIIVFCMIFFVILYVWQNIEVMKLKMDYRKSLRVKEELIKDNDRLLFEIEKYKRMDVIEKYVSKRGMVLISPNDFGTIEIKE